LAAVGANDSSAPNASAGTAAPDDFGVRSAEISVVAVKYFAATRLTSSALTALIAATISSGEVLPSIATASLHASASP
jgi:hypothetical protein